MALVGIELETLVSEPDALTTRPPPCALTKSDLYPKQIISQVAPHSGTVVTSSVKSCSEHW